MGAGHTGSPTLSLRNAAMPFMDGVHDIVGHHVQLGVPASDEVLFLERLTAPGAVINYTRIAGRLPLHASSSGLVLLAHGPADLRERVLDGSLLRLTPNTPATAARLRAVPAEIRRQGYAYCPGYVHPDVLGIAAPVRDARGEVVAVLAVIIPNEAGATSVVPVVRTAAHGISVGWGLRIPPDSTGIQVEAADVTGAQRPYDSRRSLILMFLRAANRDADRWYYPARFDLTRDPSGHVGIGIGPASVRRPARGPLEAEALLTALARRIERIELAGSPHRHPNNTLRSWASLPLRVQPAA